MSEMADLVAENIIQSGRIKELERLLEIEREAAVFSFDDKKHILEQLAQAEATIAEMRKVPTGSPWDDPIRVCKIHEVPDCSICFSIAPTGAS